MSGAHHGPASGVARRMVSAYVVTDAFGVRSPTISSAAMSERVRNSGSAPEVTWVGPAELRHIARRAPGIAADPDQMGTPFLRAQNIIDVPDPLRSQLRTMMGLAGGRYVMIPAGLVFRRTVGRPDGRMATAELAVVMIDSRIGRVGWRTVARGEGEDPWTALTRAVKILTPGLP